MALAKPQARPETPPQPASTLEVTGHSMRFFLRPGDAVRLERVGPEALRLGDLIVALDERRLVVHRVVALLGTGSSRRVVTKGDALRRLDPAVPAPGVVGRVRAVRRGGSAWRRVDDVRGRLWSCAWGAFSTVWFLFGLPGDEWMMDKARQASEAVRRTAELLHKVKHSFYWFLSAVCRLIVWSGRALFRLALHLLRLFIGLSIRFVSWSWSVLRRAAHSLKHGSIWLIDMGVRKTAESALAARTLAAAAWVRACARSAPALGLLSESAPGPLRAILEELSRSADAAAFPVERRLRGLTPPVTRWAGEVTLIDDVVVPRGSRVVVAAGTLVRAGRAPRQPLGLSRQVFGRRTLVTQAGLCHVVVFGSLELRGAPGGEIRFDGPAHGGIVLAGGGRLRASRADASVIGLDRSRATLFGCSGAFTWAARSRAVLRSCRLDSGERGLRLHDDARAKASACSAEGLRWAVLLEGRSRLNWRGGRCAGSADAGATLSDQARLRCSAASWSGHARGFVAGGRSRLTLRRCRLVGNASGVEAVGSAAAVLEDCSVAGGEHGVWAQNAASISCRRVGWSSCTIGGRASHAALLDLRGGTLSACAKTALFVEERARASAAAAAFAGNENGALVLHEARLALEGCRVEATRDTAVWCDYRGWIDLRATAMRGNFKDFHREYRPVYG